MRDCRAPLSAGRPTVAENTFRRRRRRDNILLRNITCSLSGEGETERRLYAPRVEKKKIC